MPAITRGPQTTNRLRLALAAGIVGVLALATVSWAVFGRGKDPVAVEQPPTQSPSVAPAKVQLVEYNGITVSAPLDWTTDKTNSNYLDIKNPADGDRWMRLNAQTSEKDAKKTLESAERGALKTLCGDSYKQVSFEVAELAGTKGMQLEFLCTPKGKAQKHGVWRMAIIGGKSRHLYLQTWENTFAQDKLVFDAAALSYKVT